MKLRIIFILFLLGVTFHNITAQDESLDFFPMAVGNEWQYIITCFDINSGSDSSFYITNRFIGDTILSNGFNYKIFENYDITKPDGYKNLSVDYLYLDSLSGNIYEYYPQDTVNYPIGILRDSLFCELNDSFGDSLNRKICNEVSDYNTFGIGNSFRFSIDGDVVSKNISLLDISGQTSYQLTKRFGLTSAYKENDDMQVMYFLFYANVVGEEIGYKIKPVSDPLEYYPLHVGDFWKYEVTRTEHNVEEKWIEEKEIIGDTILSNGYRYFVFKSSTLIRIDSIDLKVYKYLNGYEKVIEDLSKQNLANYEEGYLIVNIDQELFGEIFETRVSDSFLTTSTSDDGWSLTKRIGESYRYYNDFSLTFIPTIKKLVYAKVNGVEYGTLVSMEDEQTSDISEFGLEQNYPNPFNPTTTIKYVISVGTGHAPSLRTVLKVYDLLGREVATLVNKQQSPGNYKVEFDGNHLPSGIYIYTLTTGNYSISRKMVLLK